jgi:ribosomal protein S18 acetylase RimI-like enzyme
MDRSDITIGPAVSADLPAIAELAAVIWRSHYPGIISDEQIDYMLARMYDLKTLEDDMTSGIRFDRILAGDKLVGFASYGGHGGEMKLHKLYILPQWQRRGLGAELIRRAETSARSSGCRSLIVGVNRANRQAISAYKRNGFVVRESVKTDIGNGFVMDDYIMEKRLNETSSIPSDARRTPVRKFLASNIDRRGRVVRAVYGVLMLGVGLILWRFTRAAAIAAFAAAAFAFFEAARGWCVMRACGVKTLV